MRNLVWVCVLAFTFYSCDPSTSMEANIENLTTKDLILEFISADQTLNKSLEIASNETKLFQDGFNIGNDFIEPNLVAYDSVVVKNSSQQVLKIFKPGDNGKNIFKVDEDWLLRQPSKGFYKYKYQIYNEDLD